MKLENHNSSYKIKDSLREKRIRIGYSQEFMAYCLNINQATYQKIESGKLKLKADCLIKVSIILGIDLNEFKNYYIKKSIPN
jgi:DNA-binding XRE family transcriptional regulator